MSSRIAGALGFLAGALVVALVAIWLPRSLSDKPRTFLPDAYHAVLLSSGQAYFGKIESSRDGFITLRDVFYVQSKVNADTKETTSVLVKRGNEIHGPSYMILNLSAVQYIEPVGQNSQIQKLIIEAQSKP
jgi:hypothetical protein